jgi:uncharacterized protein YndB with AHSA1/START domain
MEASLTFTRRYGVPPEKVWRAWTDAEALRQWWAPGPAEPVSLAQLDVRVGGRIRIVFGGPDGKAHECTGIYREVVPNRKLAFTWAWPGASRPQSLVIIEFKPASWGTRLVSRVLKARGPG